MFYNKKIQVKVLGYGVLVEFRKSSEVSGVKVLPISFWTGHSLSCDLLVQVLCSHTVLVAR